jgi:hypothetical protein
MPQRHPGGGLFVRQTWGIIRPALSQADQLIKLSAAGYQLGYRNRHVRRLIADGKPAGVNIGQGSSRLEAEWLAAQSSVSRLAAERGR